MSIELRLSDVDPPASEPKRTIYRDIVNLPSTVKLGLTIRYFNHDDVDLYFQITGSGTGYTFGTVNLGLLASGANAYINLDELASRAKPSASDLPNGEKEENITLILKGYTDGGYTNLKWTYERIVTVHWINSADAAFTVDEVDNFDDGTAQGWAAENIANNDTGFPTLAIATDYVLSTPYSIKMTSQGPLATAQVESRIKKDFTTPNKSKVFAIFDVRASGNAIDSPLENLQIRKDASPLVSLGIPNATTTGHKFPSDRWIRIVVPLPANTTLTLDVYLLFRDTQPSIKTVAYAWMDDFKIISK